MFVLISYDGVSDVASRVEKPKENTRICINDVSQSHFAFLVSLYFIVVKYNLAIRAFS